MNELTQVAGQLSGGHTMISGRPSLEVFVFEFVTLIAQAAPVSDLAPPEIAPQLAGLPAPGVIAGVVMTITAGLASIAFWVGLLGGAISIPDQVDEAPSDPERLSKGPALAAEEPEILTVPLHEPNIIPEEGENGESASAMADDDPSRSRLPPAALLLAIGWIGLVLLLKLASGGETPPPSNLTAGRVMVGMLVELGIQLLVFVVLFAAVVSGPGGAPWRTGPLRRELRLGLGGFLAAVGPVLTVLILMRTFRTDDSEHLFLRILREADSGPLIALIILSAAIVAPLSEELTYRVTLQGGTAPYIGRGLALVGSAVLFSMVHGFPDMVALLPLALILGWIYQRTGSYVAIVTAHAAFNLFNVGVVLVQTWWT